MSKRIILSVLVSLSFTHVAWTGEFSTSTETWSSGWDVGMGITQFPGGCLWENYCAEREGICEKYFRSRARFQPRDGGCYDCSQCGHCQGNAGCSDMACSCVAHQEPPIPTLTAVPLRLEDFEELDPVSVEPPSQKESAMQESVPTGTKPVLLPPVPAEQPQRLPAVDLPKNPLPLLPQNELPTTKRSPLPIHYVGSERIASRPPRVPTTAPYPGRKPVSQTSPQPDVRTLSSWRKQADD